MINFFRKHKNLVLIIMTILNAGVISNLTNFKYNFFNDKFNIKLMILDIIIYFISAILAYLLYKGIVSEKKNKDQNS